MIEIQLLGPTVAIAHGARRTGGDLGGTKPRQLLEMLALDLGSPVSKDLLAERLWEGAPPASYIATIESYVCVLRRKLGLPGGRRGALITTNNGYVLDADHIRVDITDVERMLRAGGAEVVRALDLVKGELLVDEPYAAWANEARESFADLLSSSCTKAAQEANEAGDHNLAVRLARVATRRSYFSEPALRELMTGLARSGSRWKALQAYEVLRAGMLAELGVEPSVATRNLYLSILRADVAKERRVADRAEINTLLQLLRQALEVDRGSLAGTPDMHEVGRLLMSRAG